MKFLAVDPGTQRVGMAACDDLEITTRLLPVLPFKDTPTLVRSLGNLIEKEEYGGVVLGLPLNMDGSQGKAFRRSHSLAEALKRELRRRDLSCEIFLWDERLTTFEAETRLREKGIPKAKAKEFLDSLAAEVLLEDYLAHKKGAP